MTASCRPLPVPLNTALRLIAEMRQRLRCPEFLARHRLPPCAFARRRHLSFARVILLVVQKGVKSLPRRLAEFFEQLALEDGSNPFAVTAGAWTQARAKLSHTAFIALNEETALAGFYAEQNRAQMRHWRGPRLCAIDGSYSRLPGREEVGTHFGWVQTIDRIGPCAARHAMANASVCFDGLNRLGIEARLEPCRLAERQLGALHSDAMRPGDLVVTDRGYCGLEGFLRVQGGGADFLCRAPRAWLAAADALFVTNQDAASVLVELVPARKQRRALRRAGLPQDGMTIRLVSVRLPNGELEVLAASLLDEARYPTAAFGEAYALRWGIETYHGLLKGRLGLENFTGETLEAVRQDFFSCVCLSNVETILSAPAQQELSARDAQRRHPLRAKRSIFFAALRLPRKSWPGGPG